MIIRTFVCPHTHNLIFIIHAISRYQIKMVKLDDKSDDIVKCLCVCVRLNWSGLNYFIMCTVDNQKQNLLQLQKKQARSIVVLSA